MKRVLMCRPDYFRVDYTINPWMKVGSVKTLQARIEWDELITQCQKLGVEVSVIPQHKQFPDMVFAADQGVRFGKKGMLVSRFRYKQRQGESVLYTKWYKDQGFEVRELPEGNYFEGGGEMQSWRNMVFIGTGFRTNREGALAVGKVLRKRVVSLKLVDARFYHLDTCLMILNSDNAFYYPPAFSPKSQADLQLLIPNLIAIDEEEAVNFATNSVVTDSTVIMQKGSKNMTRHVHDLGYRVIDVDLREFMKAGGGAHCLIGDLGE